MECTRQRLIRAIMLWRAIGQRANARRTPAVYQFALVVVLASILALAPTPRPTTLGEEPPADPTPEQIQAWIKQLGDDDFQTRERAQKMLVKAGNPAYFALEALPPSKDPEVKMRVEQTRTALELDAIEKLRARGGYFARRGDFRGKTGATEFNYFTISDDKLRDADLAPLVRLKKLETVKIENSPITDDGLLYLHPLKQTKGLNLRGTSITDKGLETLIKELPSIAGLDLSDTQVTNVGLAHLAKLHNLLGIGLTNTRVDGEGLSYLKTLEKQLVSLNLKGTRIVDDELRHLQGCSELRFLRLDGTDITGTGLQHIQNLPKLENLNLQDVELEQHALVHVAKLPALKRLFLKRTGIDVNSLLVLKDSPNLEHIYVSAQEITEAEEEAAERILNGVHREKRFDILRQE